MTTAILRHSSRDALLVLLALAHGALLLTLPSAPLIAIAMWWNANTVAHNFIHLPFFRSRRANLMFSAYLSLLLGLPQTLWRDRHLAHHANKAWRLRWSKRLAFELVLVTALWILIAARGERFFFLAWLPGWIGGLTLCWLQGYYEHVRGTVSHYGTFYNKAFFNDGYHIEHHARPGVHWSKLPEIAPAAEPRSRWPAVLRWLDQLSLEGLERLVLRSRWLQAFVVDRHARAFRRLLGNAPNLKRVTIVGGALFPRTALVLHKVAPAAQLTIIDRSAGNIARARTFLNGHARVVEGEFTADSRVDGDLLVIPLAYDGDREKIYAAPPAPAVLVHDWIWNRRGRGAVVSILLLKRLNLVHARVNQSR